MLEKFVHNPLINVVMTIFMTWFALSIYRGTNINASSFELKINLLPYWIMFLIFLIWLVFTLIYRKKYKPANFNRLNPELRDDDEAYSWVTNKACRSFYISFYYLFPVGLVIMGLGSFMERLIPGFAIYVFAAIGIIQYIVYWWHIKKLSHK